MKSNNKFNKESDFNTEFKTDPIKISYQGKITKDSYAYSSSCLSRLDNTFTVFKSNFDNKIYLIYANINKSIISYDLIGGKKINELKNAHKSNITNFRYYLDKEKKRDLLLSISSDDRNLKLWNINNSECLTDLKNIYDEGSLYSGCFLNDNNEIYIAACGSKYSQPIKVFDFNGKMIKEIDNKLSSYIIESFYDDRLSQNYIITGNDNCCKSYIYQESIIYKIYTDNNYSGHYNIIIHKIKDIYQLIDSSGDGYIRIWDFHSSKLIKKFYIDDNRLYGICLWNNNYIFIGCLDKTIKIMDLNKEKIVKTLKGHKRFVLTMKKIFHPIYGECLLSQGHENDQIKIWTNQFF